MIEHNVESKIDRTYDPHPWMTDKQYELFSPIFLPFAPKNEVKEGMEAGGPETGLTDAPAVDLEMIRELKDFADMYMAPFLYDKMETLDFLPSGRLTVRDVDIGPNCQAFALKMPVKLDGSRLDDRPYPGYYAGLEHPDELIEGIGRGDVEYVKKEMSRLIAEDVKAMGGELVEVDKDYKCSEGEWKICMLASTDMEDYHFMRECDTGWFHKEGVMGVTCLDKDYKLITDPEHCKTNYDQFLGYYVIRNAVGKEMQI